MRTDQWKGDPVDREHNQTVLHGPVVIIRHPLWSASNPRQDIPIMVFTQKQWHLVQSEQFAVSAAPIGPGELGRNKKYVFALPPRFDYAFPTGYEEVEVILRSKALHSPCMK